MQKKMTPPANLISPIASTLGFTATRYNNGIPVASKEETKERKQKLLSIVNSATDQFASQLQAGNIELTSTLDLERLTKLFLVLSGEASDIQGHVDSATGELEQKISMTRVEEILANDDPAVLELFSKLYEGYNQLNDNANEGK